MKAFIISGYLLLSVVSLAQPADKEQQAIVEEGFELYRLELAAWNASDLLSSIWGVSSLDSIEGYVSYRQGNSYNTIFYGGDNPYKVYANFVFDSVCSIESAIMDITPRIAAKKETELILIRTDALERVWKNEGKFFELFENTSFNLIPVIHGNSRKVVVLTAPKEDGNVLFGNDYVLEYTADNKFQKRTKLHRNLIPIPMESQSDSIEVSATIHSHLEPTPEYITATDICSLLLYGEYTNWKQHFVFSDKFVSIWDVEKKSLLILTRKAFDKIYADQEKR